MTLKEAKEFFRFDDNVTPEEISNRLDKIKNLVKHAQEAHSADYKYLESRYSQACLALMEIAPKEVLEVNPQILTQAYLKLGVPGNSSDERIEKRLKEYLNFVEVTHSGPEMKEKAKQEIYVAYTAIMNARKYAKKEKDEQQINGGFVQRVEVRTPTNADKSKLYNPNLVKNLKEASRPTKLSIYKDDEISIFKIGTLNYTSSINRIDGWVDKYEVLRATGERAVVYTDLVKQDFIDPNYINFVKSDLLSPGNINVAQIHNGGYVGHPNRNKEGRYERYYSTEALSAVMKNKLAIKMPTDRHPTI